MGLEKPGGRVPSQPVAWISTVVHGRGLLAGDERGKQPARCPTVCIHLSQLKESFQT